MASELSEGEADVLALIGQQTKQWYNSGSSETVVEAAKAKGYSAKHVDLAIGLLEKKNYLKVSFRSLLQLTPNGYYAYAETNVPGFAALIQGVEAEICKNNHTNNRDVAKALHAGQMTIDYIFDMMFQVGTLNNGNNGNPLAAAGPVWYIMEISPEFRLKCAEASDEIMLRKFAPRIQPAKQAVVTQKETTAMPPEEVNKPDQYGAMM